MKDETLKVAVCGHIDHGKSTLIGRLLLDTKSLPRNKLKELDIIAKAFGEEAQLAHLSDQLKEERERRITIETTQIFFKTSRRSYCLIDTPGHLEFIRNMLTGTSQADAAVLVVDIHEGVQDQTRRHAYLLKFLSLCHIIVVVNKMDLAQYSKAEFKKIEEQILALFSELQMKPPPIIPAGAKRGENISRPSKFMSWHRGPYLLKALDGLTLADQSAKPAFRLPVQDIYKVHGEEIIVGKIVCGRIREGQKILVLPQGRPAVIKTINLFGKKKKSAAVDQNIGLTLTAPVPIERGNVFCEAEASPHLPQNFRGNIFWLHSSELAEGQTVELRCATQVLRCTVAKIMEAVDPAHLTLVEKNASVLKQNQAGLIEFTLLTAAVLEKHSDIPELGRYTIETDAGLFGAGTVLSLTT